MFLYFLLNPNKEYFLIYIVIHQHYTQIDDSLLHLLKPSLKCEQAKKYECVQEIFVPQAFHQKQLLFYKDFWNHVLQNQGIKGVGAI